MPLKFYFIKKVDLAEWESRSITPKRPPAISRLINARRAINNAPVSTFWPMQTIETERNNMEDSRAFAALDFRPIYLEVP